MKNCVVVSGVMVVSVAVPLACSNMNLDIPVCSLAAYEQNGIMKITTCPMSEPAGVYYLEIFSRICHELGQLSTLPNMCHQVF